MPIVSMLCVSVRCDRCGYGFDECYARPKFYFSVLKENG